MELIFIFAPYFNMERSMEENLKVISDIDLKQIDKHGPLPNNFDSLENSDFVNEDDTKRNLKLYNTLVHDHALKHWSIKPK